MSENLAMDFVILCDADTERLLTNTSILSWMETVNVAMETMYGVMEDLGVDSLDIDWISFLVWMFLPIMVAFILPVFVILLLYLTALIIHIYRARHKLRDAFAVDVWLGARKTVALLWELQGKIWHGYEIHGVEKLPATGPALVVYYHGAIPIDLYYVMAKVVLHQNRLLYAVADRFLFKIPGWNLMLKVMCVTPGAPEDCIKLLREGNLLSLSPGGVREALFGDEYYRLVWKNRMGFAKVAKKAKVPIYPMFTQNCREGFRSIRMGRHFLEWVYEKTRLPIVPIYGGFPVKFRTYIGDPIPYDPNVSAQELAVKTHNALERMIDTYQKIPGTVFGALLDRVPAFSTKKED
ncbi:DGAT1/2-independent enzyme synthesizing storage lipids-like [Branchiostoma floridae x Branchiostoma japonicum]